MNLIGLNDSDRAVVHKFTELLVHFPDNEKLYRQCRGRLLALNKKLWPRAKKGISLYSGRHQFGANCKAMGLSCAEIAAMFGHGSEETPWYHYAGARYGYRKGGVQPTAADKKESRSSEREPPNADENAHSQTQPKALTGSAAMGKRNCP